MKQLNENVQVAMAAIERGLNINVTLSGEDLKGFANCLLNDFYDRKQREEESKKVDQCDSVSPKVAMELLGVSPATLWRYAKSKLLTQRHLGGKVYYSRAEITNLLKG